MDRKTARQRAREADKPFTLILILKHGGKKLRTESITFFSRTNRPKGIIKALKESIEDKLKEV